jgi:hypothetical protein
MVNIAPAAKPSMIAKLAAETLPKNRAPSVAPMPVPP